VGQGLNPCAALQSQSGLKPAATVLLPERFRASCAFGDRPGCLAGSLPQHSGIEGRLYLPGPAPPSTRQWIL